MCLLGGELNPSLASRILLVVHRRHTQTLISTRRRPISGRSNLKPWRPSNRGISRRIAAALEAFCFGLWNIVE
ncbi:hypothetical protein OPV22_014008 [Ensete ventricosum]|uniref:Uncharacterized protein n=1 Tax=Ensete ventricosum TaxID=4639 RepID=A0AAV8R6T3_ENSVE|nr:hypothetical protein OPV22_014008 [Ensete ventricosum]